MVGDVDQRVGGWQLRAKLGAGAFGETWRATRDDGTVAAVKLLQQPPEGELRALGRLCHPAIPQILDTARRAPWFIAMDLAPGRPLTEWMDHRRLSLSEALAGFVTLFDALATVHAASLRHGDIKPDNILWCRDDDIAARLVDFGLSDARGGTLAWAAPEVVAGDGPVAASDVYSLGMVMWNVVYGEAPYSDGSLAEALARRALAVPVLPAASGSSWLGPLLLQLLHPSPDHRPTAAAVVDTFRAHGIFPPEVTAELLTRRAATAVVHRGSVDAAAETWIRRGGQLSIVGVTGSGRTRALERLLLELAAQGRPSLRMGAHGRSWGGVAAALATMGVALPASPDDPTRVGMVASLLLESGLPLLVDDFESLDHWSREVVVHLASTRADFVVCSRERPTWARRFVHLEPLDGQQIGSLLTELLGEGADQAANRRAVWRASHGLMADAVRFIITSVESGAFVPSSRTWVLDEARVRPLAPRSESYLFPEPRTREGRVLLALAWTRRPLSREQLIDLFCEPAADMEAAVHRLVSLGLVQVDAQTVRPRAGVDVAVRAQMECDRTLLAGVVAWMVRAIPEDYDVLAWLAVDLGDRSLVEAMAPRALDWLISRNPEEAANLADVVWEKVRTPATLDVCLRAWIAAGRTREAREVGVQALSAFAGEYGASAELGAAMVTMAELASNHGGRPDDALDWCQRARECVREGEPVSARLILAEAQACSLLGDSQGALDRTRTLAGGAPPVDAVRLRLWLRARTIAAQSTHQLGDLTAAVVSLETVDASVGVGLSERAVLSAALGRLYWFAGRYSDADRAMSAAGEQNAGLGMLDRARLVNNLGAVRHHSGDRAGAVAAWEQALVLFHRVDAHVEAVRTQSNLCVGYKELGRWERSRQAGEAALAGARHLDAFDLMCNAALNLGELHLCRGQLIEAEERIREAAHIAEDHNLERERVEAELRRVELDILRNRNSACRAAQRVAEAATKAGMLVEHCLAAAFVAVCIARSNGGAEELETWISRAVQPLQKAGAAADLAVVRLWVAEAFLDADRPRDAATEVDRARVFARERGNVPLLRRAEALDARLAARWKDPERDNRLGQLVEVAVAINEQSDLSDVFERIAQAGLELLEGERAFVLTGHPPQVVAAVAHGPVQGRPSMSVVEQAIRDRREVIAADVDERGDLRALRSVAAMELRSVLCVPMHHHDEVIGAIYVDSRAANQQHLWESAELMRGLAAMAAVAVVKVRYFEDSVRQARAAAQLAERERVARELAQKNAQLEALNEQLRRFSVTDPLTGIGNRRHMVEVLTDAVSSAYHHGIGFSVIIVDIDFFKRINDTWGHPAGDRVIAETARRIQEALPAGDRVFRYGGEEMVVLTAQHADAGLATLCERLRQVIGEAEYVLGDGRWGRVTASLGASAWVADQDARWEDVLHRADAALYAAKAGGRNRTVLSSELGALQRAGDGAVDSEPSLR